MSDVIFTKITVLKKDLYTTLKGLMITAGWQNISSNALDEDVMFSTGNSGNLKLCFNLSEKDPSSQLFSSTLSNFIRARHVEKYTPGLGGNVGIFARNDQWSYFNIANGQSPIPLNTVLTIYYHVDKNRIIFAVQPPLAFNVTSTLHYIGQPNITYLEEHDSTGLILASNSYSGPGASAACMIMSGNPYLTVATPYVDSVMTNIFCKSINSAGKRNVSQISYGNITDGVRGIMDGILVCGIDSCIDGDIWTDTNGYKYLLVTGIGTYGSTIFYSAGNYLFALLRIA